MLFGSVHSKKKKSFKEDSIKSSCSLVQSIIKIKTLGSVHSKNLNFQEDSIKSSCSCCADMALFVMILLF